MIYTINNIKVTDLAKDFGTPLYVYDGNRIEENIKDLKNSISYPKLSIKYACKANSNLHILKLIKENGLGLDTVSYGEVFLGLKAGFAPEEIIFTGDNTTEEEFEYCVKNNVMINIGSIFQLDLFGSLYPNSKIMIRINPDVGAGHHDHCITGGPASKFGIYIDQIDEAKKIAKKYNLKIVGIHSHIGSGILDVDIFIEAMDIILNEAKKFDDLDIIDIGGGIGIPYYEHDKPIDIKLLGAKITNKIESFNKEYKKEVNLYIEPGRYIVGNAGYLLAEVVNKKKTPLFNFVGINSGFNHLIRPMAYGSHHRIINGSNYNSEKKEFVMVAGNLCESGDIFTKINGEKEPYKIDEIRYKDILVIMDAGAYGFSMSSNYNFRERPAEVIIKDGIVRIIRKREKLEDLLRGME
ncbi:MAG TPA: diaminopimelate decarboxylase [Spirochaetota bacterium]|nr:diaminopimelate decarboxylase [Spirochaetota bacterium]HOM38994.1 diaminopimelate decarboxylase [Spirochaetota bacterium]HPQ48347.1 diaminopimelate decarboxylase [Spirochaetota bacterium]